jgi:hypothetical protein
MSSFTAQIALIGWVPVVVLLFVVLRPRNALLVAFVAGWLFLPVANLSLPGLPDYGKMEATSLGALLGVLLFDPRAVMRLRPSWVDLPLVLWCLAPIPTALSNELGLYDGMSGAFTKAVTWAIPFFLGRIYLGDLPGIFQFEKAFVLGAMAYIPLCWLEIRLSPQLHTWVYGYFQHSFLQTIRYGGYRPVVFLPHGIAVSTYFAFSAAILFWWWRSEAVKRVLGVPVGAMLAAALLTLIGCKTLSGLALFLLIISCYWVGRAIPIRAALLAFLLLPVLYMTARLADVLPAETLVELAARVDEERAGSLGARLEQEDLFSEHTWHRPVLGWGGWRRNFPTDEYGRPLTRAVDGFWTIALSQYGLFGLAAATGVLLIGPTAVFARIPSRELSSAGLATVVSLAFVVCAHAIDSLFNGMPNPLVYLGAGGLAQCALDWRRVPVPAAAGDPVRPVRAQLLPRKLVAGRLGH